MKLNHYKKLLAIAILPAMLAGCVETGSAEKIGTIVKVGNGEGVFNKTLEAEIIRGGFNSGSGASGQSFHFTIEDPKIADQLRVAMDKNQEVKIKYHTEMFARWKSESHGVFLDSFEIVNHTNTQDVKNSQKNINADSNSSNNSNNVIYGSDRKEKIVQLLKVQAQLIEELAAEQNISKDNVKNNSNNVIENSSQPVTKLKIK